MTSDDLRIREIASISRETPSIKTFLLYDPPSADSAPGQFVMTWVPSSGEIPLAISGVEGDRIALTVKRRGQTTEVLHEMNPGDQLGIRGPFGNGFSSPPKKSLLVGGGYGIAPLRYLYQRFSRRVDFSVIEGAKTAAELLFLDEIEPIRLSTDDGSRGYEGSVIGPLRAYLDKEKVDKVYTSGPEKMIYQIFEICESRELELEASLERIMKCGVGLCGSCLIDGFRVCKDGPVVDLEGLQDLEEFGNWKRTSSGKRKPI